MGWTKITEELKQRVLEVYPFYSDIETCRRIGKISRSRLFKVVEILGLKRHTREENYRLGQKLYKENSLKNHNCEHAATSKEIKEKRYKTNLDRYGSISPFGNIQVQQKSQQTLKANYGVDNPMHSEEIKNTLKQANLEKYGVEYSFQAKEIKEKIKQTNLERYNVEYASQNEKIKAAVKQTCKERYGVENPFQVKEFQEKIRQTNLERYGVEYATQSNEVQNKIKQINLERYGVEWYFQTKECKEKAKQINFEKYGIYHAPSRLYKYQEQSFDSFPELCFYMYYIENNIEIIREPTELTFTFEDKEYHYYPDFLVNNQLVEIKGKQFLKEDGTWCNPYDHSLDKLFEAKHRCALANNVKILYKDEYQKYLDWFNNQGYKKEDFIVL